MTTFTRIASLDDIDFDGMFAASLPAMDAGTYPWPDYITDETAKKSMFAGFANALLAEPASLCFKGEREGLCVVAGFGVLSEGTYSSAIGLLRPDRNNSRAFIYDAEYLASYYAFLRAAGATSLALVLPRVSSIRKSLGQRHSFAEGDVLPWPDGVSDRVTVTL